MRCTRGSGHECPKALRVRRLRGSLERVACNAGPRHTIMCVPDVRISKALHVRLRARMPYSAALATSLRIPKALRVRRRAAAYDHVRARGANPGGATRAAPGTNALKRCACHFCAKP